LILAAALPAVSIPEWPLYSGVFDCTGSFLHWDSTGSLQGARRLLVSDNPETIGTGLSGLSSALWWDGFMDGTQTGTSKAERLFVWHRNTTGGTCYLAITLENKSTTNDLQVSSARCTGDLVHSAFLQLGEANAYYGLVGLPAWSVSEPSVPSGTTKLLWSTSVPNTDLFGGLFECTVQRSAGTGNMNYVLRTAWYKTGEDPRTFGDPCAPSGPHPRGS
jgi:hypothetical protein